MLVWDGMVRLGLGFDGGRCGFDDHGTGRGRIEPLEPVALPTASGMHMPLQAWRTSAHLLFSGCHLPSPLEDDGFLLKNSAPTRPSTTAPTTNSAAAAERSLAQAGAAWCWRLPTACGGRLNRKTARCTARSTGTMLYFFLPCNRQFCHCNNITKF